MHEVAIQKYKTNVKNISLAIIAKLFVSSLSPDTSRTQNTFVNIGPTRPNFSCQPYDFWFTQAFIKLQVSIYLHAHLSTSNKKSSVRSQLAHKIKMKKNK